MEQNKTGKYLKYAIGEIVLVVIGILIALSINNTNEIRKNENAINSILKQVQSELVTSIKESEDIMKYYMKKDSLIYIVMTNKVTYDDYKNKKIRGLMGLGQNYTSLKIQKDGYLNLMNYIKKLPKGLDSLITDLKRIYVNDADAIEKLNTTMAKAAKDFSYWQKHNTTYSAVYYFNDITLSDKQINFFLNDPYYKNVIAEYFNFGLENHYEAIAMFRYRAINSYRKITSYLNLNEDASSEPSPFQQNTETYKKYLGNFKSKIDTIMISTKNKEFIFQRSTRPEKYSIIPVDTTSFIPTRDYFYYLKFDKKGNVIGMTRRIGDHFQEYTKIK